MVAVSPVVPLTNKACTPPSIILCTCFLNPSKSILPSSCIGNTSATALPLKIVIISSYLFKPNSSLILVIAKSLIFLSIINEIVLFEVVT